MILFLFLSAIGQDAEPKDDPSFFKTRIQEAVVFKDGHSYVLRGGTARPRDGAVWTKDVPAPLLGTFWSAVRNPGARIESVAVYEHESTSRRPCLSTLDLLLENKGKKVVVTEEVHAQSPVSYDASVVEVPTYREGAEAAPRTADFVLLKTDKGTRAVPIAHIRTITFVDEPARLREEPRKEPRILVRTAGVRDDAQIDFATVERGLRWIPEYRVEILDDHRLAITLQAMIVNDLADFEDAKLHLVVGIPNFLMKGSISPMALRHGLGTVAARLQQQESQFGNFANSQYAALGVRAAPEAAAPEAAATLDPNIAGQAQEDFFLYSLPSLSLKKGGRMTVQILRTEAPFDPVYKLKLMGLPLKEALANFTRASGERGRDIVREIYQPKAYHTLSIRNGTMTPWTTGPALILKEGKVLAQEMLHYTAPGDRTELILAAEPNLAVKLEHQEASRVETRLLNSPYFKISIRTTIALSNFVGRDVPLCVEAYLLGSVTAAPGAEVTRGANFAQLPYFEDVTYATLSQFWWWSLVNESSRAIWTATLKAGAAPQTLTADWHYFYRN